jgi:hypothetical protein
MRHQKWAPAYYTKREILEMDNISLLNAFEQAAGDSVIATNHRAHYPAKLAKQIEWMRDELLTRLR